MPPCFRASGSGGGGEANKKGGPGEKLQKVLAGNSWATLPQQGLVRGVHNLDFDVQGVFLWAMR